MFQGMEITPSKLKVSDNGRHPQSLNVSTRNLNPLLKNVSYNTIKPNSSKSIREVLFKPSIGKIYQGQ